MTPRRPLTAEAGRLPRVLLAVMALPGVPLAAFSLPVYVHIPAFYAVDLGLGVAGVGLVLLLARSWDVVTDPVIGWLSDRTRGRFGRRRPWIAAGAPLTLLATWLLFVPPDGVGLAYLGLTTVLLYLGWTMVIVPYTSWGAEITLDYHQRSRITAWREGAVIIGTVLAAGLFALPSAAERAVALELLAIAILVLLPIALIVILARVPDPQVQQATPLSFRKGAALLLENRPFARLLAAWLLNGIANGLPASLFVLYVENRLASPDKSGLLLLAYFMCGIAGLPLWLALSRRWSKHRAWCVAMIWTSAFFAWAPTLGPGDAWLFLGVCIATGLGLGADLALPPSMQADVVDLDTARGGGKRTGLYFSLWGMATKLSLALAVGLAFPLLGWAGFDATADKLATQGTLTLALLYGGAPVLFKIAAIALIWRHPVDRAAQEKIRGEIEGAI